MEQIHFRAMGCQMMAALDCDAPGAADYLDRVPLWFEEWEQCLSRFREDSELTRLNARPGEWVRVSETLWQVVRLAVGAAEQSSGLVTPTLLHALEAVGYDRTFEDRLANLERGQPTQVGSAVSCRDFNRPRPDWRAIRFDAKARAVFLPHGMRLDLGGVAKGWAADRVVERLSEYGPALMDAGGDLAANGRRRNGQGWCVGVANPAAPAESLALVMLGKTGVATSGRDYRRWQVNGVWQHHILDPRTDLPAQSDVLAATIVAPNAAEAEIAAKVVLILGSRVGIEWLEARPDFAGLLVVENSWLDTGGDGHGQIPLVICSSRMQDYLWS